VVSDLLLFSLLINFVSLISVGPVVDTFPHPSVDMKAFVKELNTALSLEPKVWDPISQVAQPWIKINDLKKSYKTEHKGGCVIA
jgi:hypothetical protein